MFDGPDAGDEDERVLVAPLAVAHAGELTEWAVVVRLGSGLGLGGVVLEELPEPEAEPAPVGEEFLGRQRLDVP